MISLFIDSCAWNCLFDDEIDLSEAFPSNRFKIYITREIEIELQAIPDIGKEGTDKRALKTYIATNLRERNVTTTSVFGFASVEPDGSLSKVQTYGGFDQGTWQSNADRDWYDSSEVKRLLHGKSKTGSGLSRNQADASLAVRAFDSIILTAEPKSNPGPLQLASEQGARVVYFEDVRESGLTLTSYFASL